MLGADVEALVLDLLTEDTGSGGAGADMSMGRRCWRRWRSLCLSAHMLVSSGGPANPDTAKLHHLLDQLLEAATHSEPSIELVPAELMGTMVGILMHIGDKATTVRCVSGLLNETLLPHPPPGGATGDGGSGDGDDDAGGLRPSLLNAAVALVNGRSAHRDASAAEEEATLTALLLPILDISAAHTTPAPALEGPAAASAKEDSLSLALRRNVLQLLCATRQGLDALVRRLCLGPGTQLVSQMLEVG